MAGDMRSLWGCGIVYSVIAPWATGVPVVVLGAQPVALLGPVAVALFPP